MINHAAVALTVLGTCACCSEDLFHGDDAGDTQTSLQPKSRCLYKPLLTRECNNSSACFGRHYSFNRSLSKDYTWACISFLLM